MAQSSPIAAARRNSELGLVIMAAGITAVAYVLAALGKNSVMPATVVPFLVALLGLLIAAHIAVRLMAGGADATLLPIAVLLNGIGYVMIARLNDERAAKQTTWTFVAIVAFVLTLLVVSAHRTSPATSGRSSSSAPGRCSCRSCRASAAVSAGRRSGSASAR